MANSSFTATVAPPHRLLRPLHVNEKKLFGPGPSNMPPVVQEGLTQPLLGHMHPEFFEVGRIFKHYTLSLNEIK